MHKLLLCVSLASVAAAAISAKAIGEANSFGSLSSHYQNENMDGLAMQTRTPLDNGMLKSREEIKSDILNLAESFKGLGDPDFSKQKQLNVLVEKLLQISRNRWSRTGSNYWLGHGTKYGARMITGIKSAGSIQTSRRMT
jgi:hypothetical protein